MTDLASSFGNGLFGAISWPVSRFHLKEGLLLEQQMFLAHHRSTAPISWTLQGDAMISAQLVVRPFFSGWGRARTGISDFVSTPNTLGDGLRGFQMRVDQKSSPTPMAVITTNRFGFPIVFATKKWLRLQRKI